MTNTTKLALEAALKKELLMKSLDKITINELAEDCGISRMAFYYHFKDIYDLVELSLIHIFPLMDAERRALAAIGEQEAEILLKTMKKHTEFFREEIEELTRQGDPA